MQINYKLTKYAFYHNYVQLMRLPQPIGIFLLLWPTLTALFLASDNQPKLSLIIIFTLGVILMRSAGCVINDIADRDFDKHVQRTKMRPLTCGKISLKNAYKLLGILILSAFVLVCFTNSFTIYLSLIAMSIALIYPFVKRVSHLPQVVLGIAFAFGIPMSYAAVNETLPLECWILFLGALLSTVAYDTLYAMADRVDDKKIGVKSSAILFGRYDKLIILLLELSAMILWIFLFGKMAFCFLFFILYEQWLIRERNAQKCFQAFLNHQWNGLFLFILALSTHASFPLIVLK